jgi:hypothetical protein
MNGSVVAGNEVQMWRHAHVHVLGGGIVVADGLVLVRTVFVETTMKHRVYLQ